MPRGILTRIHSSRAWVALAGASDAIIAHDIPKQPPIRGRYMHRHTNCLGSALALVKSLVHDKSHSLQYSSLEVFASGVAYKVCDAKNRGCVVGETSPSDTVTPPAGNTRQ